VDFASIIQIYNQKLKHFNDPRRFIRLCSYDDREAALLLPEQVAAKLYMSGAGCIFEDVAADIEPKQPSLERLS